MKKISNEKGITLIILVLTITVILILTSITVPAVTQKISQINEKKEESYQKAIQEEIKYEIEQARKNGLIQGEKIPLDVLSKILAKHNATVIDNNQIQLINNNSTYIFEWDNISTMQIKETYIKENLILHYDGIDNTRTGNNPLATSWEDLTDNKNDGSFVNSVRYLPNEKGYEMTDSNSYIISEDNLAISTDPDITIEIVFKWYGKGGQQYNGLYYIGDGNYYSSNIAKSLCGFISAESKFKIDMVNKGIISNEIVNKNQIITLAFTKTNGAFVLNNLKQYINSVNCTSTSSVANSTNLGSNPIRIGIAWGNGRYGIRSCNGIVYAIRVYNRVLTQEELNKNYLSDVERFND